MKSIVYVVILAVISNAVSSHHHHGFHHGHHDHEFYHHRPWDNNPYPWKDIMDRSNEGQSLESPDSPESPESSDYDSNEWGHHGGNDDWWDTNSSPPTPLREPGFHECTRMCHLPTNHAPVCGTDNITYKNLDHLHCARQCGIDVSVRKLSKCLNDVNNHGGWYKPPLGIPSTNGNGYWTRPTTKTPSWNGNDYWTKNPSTNGFNVWSKTPKITPSTNSIDLWTRLTPRTPTIGDSRTNRPPNTWNPSDNANNGWTTPITSTENSIESCITSCAKSTSNSPVCGTNNVIYNNLEHLLCAQLCGVDVTEQRLSECKGNNDGNVNPESTTTSPVQGRITTPASLQTCINSCPSTTEYNPVCGTDGVTYNNLGQLWCAQQCGQNVTIHRLSPCPATAATQSPTDSTTRSLDVTACIRSCPVTSEFNPVCGTDGMTYSNTGRLECAKYCGVDVEVQRNSACPTTPVTFGLETSTISMVPSTNEPMDQNKHPMEPTSPSSDNGLGFTIPADLIASVFTAPTTAAPEDDIDPRFNGRNNNTDNSSFKNPE